MKGQGIGNETLAEDLNPLKYNRLYILVIHLQKRLIHHLK